MQTYFDDFNADFTCKHCGHFVTANRFVSGVNNRNHCPYCLHSRHVDLFEPGDRLCACKGIMAPVGLTFKRSTDKYARRNQGELMLVHCCQTCGDLSINRIAADDDSWMILRVLDASHSLQEKEALLWQQEEIHLLSDADLSAVRTRLFGFEMGQVINHAPV